MVSKAALGQERGKEPTFLCLKTSADSVSRELNL